MDELKRLLKLTKENKSLVVQDFRKEVMRYVNEQNEYISELEMQNFGLFRKTEMVNKERMIMNHAIDHETIMRDLLVKEYGKAQG